MKSLLYITNHDDFQAKDVVIKHLRLTQLTTSDSDMYLSFTQTLPYFDLINGDKKRIVFIYLDENNQEWCSVIDTQCTFDTANYTKQTFVDKQGNTMIDVQYALSQMQNFYQYYSNVIPKLLPIIT